MAHHLKTDFCGALPVGVGVAGAIMLKDAIIGTDSHHDAAAGSQPPPLSLDLPCERVKCREYVRQTETWQKAFGAKCDSLVDFKQKCGKEAEQYQKLLSSNDVKPACMPLVAGAPLLAAAGAAATSTSSSDTESAFTFFDCSMDKDERTKGEDEEEEDLNVSMALPLTDRNTKPRHIRSRDAATKKRQARNVACCTPLDLFATA
mmetsp:Transcript_5035/g.12703  ORF Transcript_5035/g.12703 Transcript_5035/m.12703 type:complete len:204 (-) Transcript_5035:654-1265(-)